MEKKDSVSQKGEPITTLDLGAESKFSSLKKEIAQLQPSNDELSRRLTLIYQDFARLHALRDQSEKLIAYASERYRSVTRTHPDANSALAFDDDHFLRRPGGARATARLMTPAPTTRHSTEPIPQSEMRPIGVFLESQWHRSLRRENGGRNLSFAGADRDRQKLWPVSLGISLCKNDQNKATLQSEPGRQNLKDG
jgi:hypothetical protein